MLIVDFKPGTRSWGSFADAGAEYGTPIKGVTLALVPGASEVDWSWGSMTETWGARRVLGRPVGINHGGWSTGSVSSFHSSFQRRVGSDQGDGRARF